MPVYPTRQRDCSVSSYADLPLGSRINGGICDYLKSVLTT